MCSFSCFWPLVFTCSIQSLSDFQDTIILLIPGTAPTGPWAPWSSLPPVLLKILLFGTFCDSLSVLPIYCTVTHHTSHLDAQVNFPCLRVAYTKRNLTDTPTLTHKLKLQHSSSLRHPVPGMSHMYLTHPACTSVIPWSSASYPDRQPSRGLNSFILFSLEEMWGNHHSNHSEWRKKKKHFRNSTHLAV